MRRLFNKIIILFIFTINLCLAANNVLGAAKDIIILHTNDIHCGIEDNIGMAALAEYKNELSKNNHVLLVDSGDAVQGAPLGKLSEGQSIINIMNTVGYDFAVPGNHEFDYGMDRFFRLSQQLECGYYSANFLEASTHKNVFTPYKIFDVDGIKLAFIGVTTPETLTSSTPVYFQNENGEFNYTFCEGHAGKILYKQIQKNIDAAKQQGAEYVFLIGHLGLNGTSSYYNSAAIIRNTSGLSAVFDGHSHEQIAGLTLKDKKGNDVIVGQTGTKLQAIGKLTLKSDGSMNYELIRSVPAKNENISRLIAKEKAVYEPLLQAPVGKALVPLYVNDPITGKRLVRSKECSMGNFVADAYRKVLNTDVAIVNGGGIRNDLTAGIFSYNDVLKVLPFGNMGMVIEATGQQILDALELGAVAYPQESGAFLQVSGISYTIDSSIPSSVKKDEKGNFIGVTGPYRVKNVIICGKKLEVDKKYTLAGSSYILRDGGNGMTMFKNARVLNDATSNETDIFIEYVQNHLNAVIDYENTETDKEKRITVK